ncbi:MAG: YbaN family protein [Petrimonas sp.]|jgi:hypothetical protein
MNIPEEVKLQPISREITLVEAKRELEANKIKRILFAIGGSLALILAILGIFVPGIPCTPFALLSAALFAKSSEKLYNWLLSNKILGPRIKSYQRRKGISISSKIKVIILMLTMVFISAFVIVKMPAIKFIILSAGLIGAITVWFFVPEGKDYTESD